MILAIDPGPTESAYVLWDGRAIKERGKVANQDLIEALFPSSCDNCVIEKIASYGMAVGAEVFETVFWTGKFAHYFEQCGFLVHRITRGEVKMHLCHSMKAKDGNIRQALIDRFGGKDMAIGNKKAPGPLYGISGDVWAALAVAVTFTDTKGGAA